MTNNPTPLSKYVLVDTSPARLARLWALVGSRLESTPPRSRWHGVVLPVLVLSVLGAVAIFWNLRIGAPAASAFSSAKFETKSDQLAITLDDGSKLELFKESRLDVLPSGPQAAVVRLQRGTVLCDLVPQRKRHFSVMAADLEVRVTGTLFRVSLDSEGERVNVDVERGSVMIRGPSELQSGRTIAAGEHWSRASDPVSHAQAQPTPSASDPVSHAQAQPTPSASVVEPIATVSTPQPPIERTGPVGRNEAPLPDPAEPLSASALFDRANLARRAGDSIGAARDYQALIGIFPNDPRADLAAFELGRLRMGPLADLPGAIRALQIAMNRARSATLREDAMAHLVSAYAASGQHALCKKQREAYQKTYPKGVHSAQVARECPGQ